MLSGAKRCARKAFALLIVFSLAFSFPVFAAELETRSAVISIPSETYGILYNSISDNVDWGYSALPASFEFTGDSYRFSWSQYTALTHYYSLFSARDKTIEFLLNVSDGSAPDVDVSFYQFYFFPSFSTISDGTSHTDYFGQTGYYKVYADDDVEPFYISSQFTDSDDLFLRNITASVSRYLRIEFITTDDCVRVFDRENITRNQQLFTVVVDGLLVNNQLTQLDRIEINIQDIESDVEDIKLSVENIEEGVVNIEGTVTDMKEQLEDSSSPIWNAAGEKIADTIKEVFVPPEEELQTEKQELENLLNDKLGDAKVLLDQGETLVTDIRDIIGNVDSGTSVHFPGISLPMNGQTYVIIPEQNVKLNNAAFLIFQDALGMGITVLCWWSILHICEDLLYCLISGVSYWGFIRSRHDQ